MNKYKVAAISAAAIVGVSGGTFAALNLDDHNDDIAVPQQTPAASASEPSASPESESPSPSASESGSEQSSEPQPSSSAEGSSEEDSGGGGAEETTEPEPEWSVPPASSNEYFTVNILDVQFLGSGDPSSQPLFVEAEVCLDAAPEGDSDGKVDVRSGDFYIDQTGKDPHEGPALSSEERGAVAVDDGFPDLQSLAEGDCATGQLVFAGGTDVDSTVLTFSNEYGAQLTWDL